jgi:hypothetical protein
MVRSMMERNAVTCVHLEEGVAMLPDAVKGNGAAVADGRFQ